MFLIKRDFLTVLVVFLAFLLIFLLESCASDTDSMQQRAGVQSQAVYPAQQPPLEARIPAY